MRIDFKTVKASVSMRQLLSHYSITLRRSNSTYLRGSCPLPTHSSKESKYSFTVNTDKNLWTCKSDSCVLASGKRGGTVVDFVAVMEKCGIVDAAHKLQEWYGCTNGNARRTLLVEKEEPKPEINAPLAFTLKGISYHSYLESRGISKETAEEYGVGFFPGKGSMEGRIVIPIHNAKGELIAYAGRAMYGTKPKYKLPTGFQKSKVLYNLHRIEQREQVIVTEGFFDTLILAQNDVPAVALIGCRVSDEQAKLLAEFKRVIFCLDSDEAGRMASVKIAKG